jgi:hypothetical protein
MSNLYDIFKTALHEPALADTKEATQMRDALTRLYDALKQYLQSEHEGAGDSTVELAKGNVTTHLTLLVQAIERIARQKIALSNEVPREIAETVAGGVLRALYVVLTDFVRRQI